MTRAPGRGEHAGPDAGPWRARIDPADRRALVCRIERAGERLAFADVLAGWRDDAAFRAFFVRLLADAPFEAFFWETPPLSRGTLGRPYEHALVDAPPLAGTAPDPRAFARHLERPLADGSARGEAGGAAPMPRPEPRAVAPAAVFESLGRDALLVAPRVPRGAPEAGPRAPRGAESGPPSAAAAEDGGVDRAHLAAFARTAPAAEQDALWRAVADAVAARLSARPLWLSTSGTGVPWLHVRIDSRPKYYQHAPYRSFDAGAARDGGPGG